MSTIRDALEASLTLVTRNGRPAARIEAPNTTTMTIEAGCIGPVTTSPDESTYVGEVSGFVVKASPDDPNRPPLNPWTEHCPRGWPRPRICEMNEEELDRWKIRLRTDGRCLRLGVRVAPAVLPRSRRLRRALEAEAETDPLVRAALDRCVEAEQTPPGEDHPPPLQRGHPHPLSRDAKDRPETPQPPRRPKADVVYSVPCRLPALAIGRGAGRRSTTGRYAPCSRRSTPSSRSASDAHTASGLQSAYPTTCSTDTSSTPPVNADSGRRENRMVKRIVGHTPRRPRRPNISALIGGSSDEQSDRA